MGYSVKPKLRTFKTETKTVNQSAPQPKEVVYLHIGLLMTWFLKLKGAFKEQNFPVIS